MCIGKVFAHFQPHVDVLFQLFLDIVVLNPIYVLHASVLLLVRPVCSCVFAVVPLARVVAFQARAQLCFFFPAPGLACPDVGC